MNSEKLNIEDYNGIPVYFCQNCLSLAIIGDTDSFCMKCGSIIIGKTDIEDWKLLYKKEYNKDYVDERE